MRTRILELENTAVLGGNTKATDEASGELASKPHYYRQGTTVEWYTPLPIVEAARRVMGGIEVDPATNEGNWTGAGTFYIAETNGLDKEWHGRVWLNPPYGKGFARWMHKLNSEFARGRTTQATFLIPVRTNAKWFQALGNGTISLCFPPSIKFINGQTLEQSRTAALMPNVIAYVGSGHDEFAEEFRGFGIVVRTPIKSSTCVGAAEHAPCGDDGILGPPFLPSGRPASFPTPAPVPIVVGWR